MEACFPKAIMSGVMGFALGGMFGMFMASVRLPILYFTALSSSSHVLSAILSTQLTNIITHRCPMIPPFNQVTPRLYLRFLGGSRSRLAFVIWVRDRGARLAISVWLVLSSRESNAVSKGCVPRTTSPTAPPQVASLVASLPAMLAHRPL